MPTMKVVVEAADGASYDVRLGTGVIDGLGERLRAVPALADARRAVVLTDSNAGPVYGGRVKAALTAGGFVVSEITLPEGESTKSADVVAELWSAFAQLKVTSRDMVVALGGGVVADVAGAAAATFAGGVNLVLVPTTLRAAVDSTVGGRWCLNIPQGRSLVQMKAQPAYCCVDVYAFASTDAKTWQCGLVDALRLALVTDDDEFLFWLSENARTLATPGAAASAPGVVMELAARAVVAKADLCGAEDEGAGAGALDFAADLCCAWESAAEAATAEHGAYMAASLRTAALLSMDLAGLEGGVADTLDELLVAFGLENVSVAGESAAVAAALKARDGLAASQDGELTLLADIGRCAVCAVSDDALADAMVAATA